jgi:hypothetical protein
LSLKERYAVPVKASDFNNIWNDPHKVLESLAEGYKSKGIKTYIETVLPLFDLDQEEEEDQEEDQE